MDLSERSRRIKAAAADLGLDRCGVAAAEPTARSSLLREWLAAGRAATMTYLHRHTASRVDLRNWLPWARSIIVVALNYRQDPPAAELADQPHIDQAPTSSRDPQGSAPLNPRPQIVPPPSPMTSPGSPRGRVAMYAWGEDYHVVLRDRLEALATRMQTILDEPSRTHICVDTSAIMERELALAAGIGWIGKNTLVLHPSLGSFFVLGEIITDLPLAPDAPALDRCGTCTRCLDACPTAALIRPHVMDARRCIAYLTIEHRSDIEPELASKMDDWVFGCDVCQTVCPYNRRSPNTTEPRFAATLDSAAPPLEDILAWDSPAYTAHVKGKATARARLAMWKRNAEIAHRNTAQPSPPPAV